MNPVDKISYEYAKEHGVVGLDYEKVYDAVKYGYNRAIEDAWKPSEEQMSCLWQASIYYKSGKIKITGKTLESLYNDLKSYRIKCGYVTQRRFSNS